MNDYTRVILALQKAGATVVYGVATGTNTVRLEGAATGVELPALSPVVSGDYCAVLQQGADRLILGAVGAPLTQYGSLTVALSGAPTAAATVTFPVPFTATPIFVCNLRGSANLFVVTAGTVTATQAPVSVFRTDGGNVDSARTVQWIAIGPV